MWQLAAALGEIALRRRGPDSLPDSGFLVGLLLGLFVAINLVDFLLFASLTPTVFVHLAAQIVLLVAYVYAVLAFFRLERRYRQTLSAIVGVEVLLHALFLPFAIGGLVLGMDLDSDLLSAVWLAFFFWSILIEATIFARAISQPLILGFMFEILYILPSLSISEYFVRAAD